MKYYSAIKRKEIMTFAAIWMDLEIIMLSEVRQWDTNIICYHLHVESKIKGHNDLLCRTDTDSDFGKSYGFQGRQVGRWGYGLGVWEGNAVKLGCDDHCANINVIKFIERKKAIIQVFYEVSLKRLWSCKWINIPVLNHIYYEKVINMFKRN